MEKRQSLQQVILGKLDKLHITHKNKFQMASKFSHSVMYSSFLSHEPQHARPPCPSPTPGVYSNSCPFSQ